MAKPLATVQRPGSGVRFARWSSGAPWSVWITATPCTTSGTGSCFATTARPSLLNEKTISCTRIRLILDSNARFVNGCCPKSSTWASTSKTSIQTLPRTIASLATSPSSIERRTKSIASTSIRFSSLRFKGRRSKLSPKSRKCKKSRKLCQRCCFPASNAAQSLEGRPIWKLTWPITSCTTVSTAALTCWPTSIWKSIWVRVTTEWKPENVLSAWRSSARKRSCFTTWLGRIVTRECWGVGFANPSVKVPSCCGNTSPKTTSTLDCSLAQNVMTYWTARWLLFSTTKHATKFHQTWRWMPERRSCFHAKHVASNSPALRNKKPTQPSISNTTARTAKLIWWTSTIWKNTWLKVTAESEVTNAPFASYLSGPKQTWLNTCNKRIATTAG